MSGTMPSRHGDSPATSASVLNFDVLRNQRAFDEIAERRHHRIVNAAAIVPTPELQDERDFLLTDLAVVGPTELIEVPRIDPCVELEVTAREADAVAPGEVAAMSTNRIPLFQLIARLLLGQR